MLNGDHRGELLSTEPSLVIRVAKPEDRSQITNLVSQGQQSWEGSIETEAEIEARIFSGNKTMIVAESGSLVVGFAAWLPESESIGASTAAGPENVHLSSLFVESGYRRQGVAERLHGEVLRRTAGQGYRRIRLWTPEVALPAQRFYEKHGYQRSGESIEIKGLNRLEFRRSLAA